MIIATWVLVLFYFWSGVDHFVVQTQGYSDATECFRASEAARARYAWTTVAPDMSASCHRISMSPDPAPTHVKISFGLPETRPPRVEVTGYHSGQDCDRDLTALGEWSREARQDRSTAGPLVNLWARCDRLEIGTRVGGDNPTREEIDRRIELLSKPLTESAPAQERTPMRELPVPVQAYLLKEAVRSGGLLDPLAMAYGDDPHIAFVAESDLNLDGAPDYTVWTCYAQDPAWRYDTPPMWKLTGNPCRMGALIISRFAGDEQYGPIYNFIELNGLLNDAKADPDAPQIIVRERQLGRDLCGETEQVCDMVYRLVEVDRPWEMGLNSLEFVKACKLDECLFTPHHE